MNSTRPQGLPWPRTRIPCSPLDYGEITRNCIRASRLACGGYRAQGMELLSRGLQGAAARQATGDYTAASLVASYVEVIEQYQQAFGGR
jgi:hypothetical protein